MGMSIGGVMAVRVTCAGCREEVVSSVLEVPQDYVGWDRCQGRRVLVTWS